MKKKYKTKVKPTSIEAYFLILKDIGFKQNEVYNCIRKLGKVSDKMIAKELNRKINTIVPRRNELTEMGLINCIGRDLDKVEPFLKVRFYSIPESYKSILNPMVIK